MKYTITINQKSIIESGVNIDIADAAILEWMLVFSHSEKINKLTYEGKLFYFFAYQKIKDDLPILGIGKDAIYRRIKKMCDLGLLNPHPENQTLNRPFYSFSNFMLSLFLRDAGGSVQTPTPPGENAEPPTVQTPDDNSINNNKIKIEGENAKAEKFKSFKDFTDEDFQAEIKKVMDANPGKFPNLMVKKFYNYWSEKTPAGKLKLTKNDTWETGKRMSYWLTNNKN